MENSVFEGSAIVNIPNDDTYEKQIESLRIQLSNQINEFEKFKADIQNKEAKVCDRVSKSLFYTKTNLLSLFYQGII